MLKSNIVCKFLGLENWTILLNVQINWMFRHYKYTNLCPIDLFKSIGYTFVFLWYNFNANSFDYFFLNALQKPDQNLYTFCKSEIIFQM